MYDSILECMDKYAKIKAVEFGYNKVKEQLDSIQMFGLSTTYTPPTKEKIKRLLELFAIDYDTFLANQRKKIQMSNDN